MRSDSPVRFALTLLLVLSTSALAAPAKPTQGQAPVVSGTAVQATPVPADKATPAVDPADPTAFRYGPIQAQDPEVRNRIKKLYRDQADLDTAAQAHLTELAAAMQAETDGDFRLQIAKDMMQTKKDLQLHSMELGLQIAQLNGDAARVADYEKALDQMLHPEKYMPATLDPSIARERAHQMGLDN